LLLERSSPATYEKVVEILKSVTKGRKYGIPNERAKEGAFELFGTIVYDNRKGLGLLGKPFIPLEKSIEDIVKEVEQHGLIKQVQ